MYAHKIHRDEDYVVRSAPVTALRLGAASDHDDPMAAVSPARVLQERLANEIAAPSAVLRTEGLTRRARAAAIIVAALLCWTPIIGVILTSFG
jgi:hypothetical protein